MTPTPFTLFSIAGRDCPIYTMEKRPPFMTGHDLSDVYETNYRRLTEAVDRNLARFPHDFAFLLEHAEAEKLPQNASTSQGKRTDLRQLVFTHAGAYALSAVLKSPVAAAVSVEVHRAFATMERQAMAEARFLLQKLHMDVTRKAIYGRVVEAHRAGWSIDRLHRASNYPRHKLETAAKELVGMAILPSLLIGMQPGMFHG